MIFATVVTALFPLTSCTKDFDNSTVDEFDLSRYLGEWYEVARYNHSFERGMDNTMAEYILQDNGKVLVLNTGWKGGKFKLIWVDQSRNIEAWETAHFADNHS